MNFSLPYPTARKSDVVDDYHGTPIADPYRWLEEANSAETKAFVESQNRLTREFLDEFPAGAAIRTRLTRLWNYPKWTVPNKKGNRYFFLKNDGLQNQAVLYRQDSRNDAPTVILDPNRLSDDGTIALLNFDASKDGRLMAYALSQSGSDWQQIEITEIDTGRTYPERLQWVKFTNLAWAKNNSGFFYSRFPDPATMADAPPTTHNRVYWHTVGNEQSEDPLIYARPDAPDLAFDPQLSDDGQYLILTVWEGTNPKNRIYYRPVESDQDFIRLLDDADAHYDFIDNSGNLFYFHTDLDAPRGRIIAIDIGNPGRDNWQEIISEGADTISQVQVIHHELIVVTLHHAAHRIHRYHLDGSPAGEIVLPTLGTIFGLSGRKQDDELFINFQSYLYPPTIFRYDFNNHQRTVWQQPSVDFDPAGYETHQIFFPSKDGTTIPMFLTHRKGLTLNGQNPALLYGYGGFNISLTPLFSPTWLNWLEMGGILAEANLRGGGEYGEAWHQAGTLANKQNVFDDFIAAAEWLIQQKYTQSSKLAIMGGSNGGLLVAACLIQRPDLYGAAICRVPVIDMLRYHKFSVGRYWVTDYGNAEENSDQFPFMLAYSPLHQVKAGVIYPPTLITTADTDDRVVPAHAYKFAATLQAANPGHNPLLLRVETKAGHGLGKPTSKIIDELTDIGTFLTIALHLSG